MSLRARRLVRGVSQRELAEIAGLTRQAIGAIEAGRASPSVKVALALADALDTSVEELFGAAPPPDEAVASRPAPARLAVARIGDRLVTRALDPGRLPALEARGEVERTAFVAGCDVALDLLAQHVAAAGGERAIWFAGSNRAALADLREGRAHVAAIHGADEELARLLAEAEMEACAIFEVGTVEEGWIVAPGAPRALRDRRRLLRAPLRIANRPRGSAARALLDAELRAAGRDPAAIAGYRRELAGQLDVAAAVAAGYADVAIAMRSAARLFGLDFVPLRGERSVLIVPRAHRGHPAVGALLAALAGGAFRRELAALDAYDVTDTGRERATGSR